MEITQYLHLLTPLKTLVIIFGLLDHHCSDAILQIRPVDSTIEVPPGQTAVIPCQFYGYASLLDLNRVLVRWTLTTSEDKEKPVYVFRGGNHTQTRPGSYIPDSGLMGGDGSLYIPNIQSSDEGKYTCFVIVTPDRAESKVTMEVSAKPTCTVSDSTLKVTDGTEGSATCNVNGFYPQYVLIHWKKHSKASSRTTLLDIDTWIKNPVQNPNGTYNMKSLLSVRPMSLEEDGDVYSCVISHRSLKGDDLMCDVILSVQPVPEPYYWITAVIPVFLALIIIGAIIYYSYHRVTLDVSPITQPLTGSLLCQISGFRPRNFKVKLYREEKTGEKTELDSWSRAKRPTVSQKEDTEQLMALQTENESRDLYLSPVITSKKLLSFSCVCYIRKTKTKNLFPNKYKDTRLILEVTHAALRKPIYRDHTPDLRAKPEMDHIQSFRVGNELELKCRIHSFYSDTKEEIKVTWYKGDEAISSDNTEPKEDDNGFYYYTSILKYTITKEDNNGKMFKCEVKYGEDTNTTSWKLEKKGVPIMNPIHDEDKKESYKTGETLKLTCCIHNYYPDSKVVVMWYKDEEAMSAEETPSIDDGNGLCSLTTAVQCDITEDDFGKEFRCEVTSTGNKRKVRSWRLRKPGSLKMLNSI